MGGFLPDAKTLNSVWIRMFSTCSFHHLVVLLSPMTLLMFPILGWGRSCLASDKPALLGPYKTWQIQNTIPVWVSKMKDQPALKFREEFAFLLLWKLLSLLLTLTELKANCVMFSCFQQSLCLLYVGKAAAGGSWKETFMIITVAATSSVPW